MPIKPQNAPFLVFASRNQAIVYCQNMVKLKLCQFFFSVIDQRPFSIFFERKQVIFEFFVLLIFYAYIHKTLIINSAPQFTLLYPCFAIFEKAYILVRIRNHYITPRIAKSPTFVIRTRRKFFVFLRRKWQSHCNKQYNK